jgi:hypothetical protein
MGMMSRKLKVTLKVALKNTLKATLKTIGVKEYKKLAFGWLFLVILNLGLLPSIALANGGTIIYPQQGQTGNVGPFGVLVTESPSPPSPDAQTHLSVLLTKANSDARVIDATILFTPGMTGMAMPDTPSRRSYPGQQPNTYDVDLPLSMEGTWSVTLTIHSPTYGDANFDLSLNVEKPSAPWPFIIGILVGLPVLAGLTWWLLFRGGNADDDEDEEEVKVGKKDQPQVGQKS